MHRVAVTALLGVLGTAVVPAQPMLHLKSRVSAGAQFLAISAEQSEPRRLSPGRRHMVIQFAAMPSPGDIKRLESQGVVVLQYVPDQALLVNAPDRLSLDAAQVILAESLQPADKISPDLDPLLGVAELIKEGEERRRAVVVELYPDVPAAMARQIATQEGIRLLEHADLSQRSLLVEATAEQLRRLAEWDDVAYVYPASQELARAERVHACEGGLTQFGGVGEYVAKIGDGWDGPGKSAAKLKYWLEGIPDALPAKEARAEIERALAAWSQVVKVDFAPGGTGRATNSIHILFATGAHSDPYPFDGPGRVLAHTFYPAPPNPEPLAGDLHLDQTESWKIGNDIDLYSVVLHELGHALGLGHSDKPGAVMYPYYRRATALTGEDISAIRELYAERSTNSGSEPPSPPVNPTPSPAPTPEAPAPTPPPTPPTPVPAPAPAPNPPAAQPDKIAPSLSITSPQLTSIQTTAGFITIKGIASDNAGVDRVSWSSNVNGTGTAAGTKEWAATIPLAIGFNTITVRAYDAAGNSAWRSIVASRK